MAVDQPWDHAAALQIDLFRIRSGERHDAAVVRSGNETEIPDCDGLGLRISAIECRDLAVEEDDIRSVTHRLRLATHYRHSETSAHRANACNYVATIGLVYHGSTPLRQKAVIEPIRYGRRVARPPRILGCVCLVD